MQFRHRRKGLKFRPWGKSLFLVMMILVFSSSFALGMSRRHHDVLVEDDPDRPNVLFVVGHHMSMGSDWAMLKYLQSKEFDVFAKKARCVQTSDTNDMDLVIISDSVWARNVNSKFSNVPIPIICSEPRLFDDLGMTGSNNKFYGDEDANNYGYARRQNKISMLKSGFDSTNPHPLAADLGTEVTVTSKKVNMSWGVPGDGAERIATLVDDSNKCTIFAYEAVKDARGKRLASPLFGRAAKWLTPEGLDLVDASINWALNSNQVSPPKVEISAEPVFIQAGEIATLNWTITDGDSAVIDHGVGDVPVQSSINVEPSVTTTYTITVTGPGGTTSAQVTVAVEDFFIFAPYNSPYDYELDYQMFTFTPDGSPNYYRLCRDIVTAFPTDPAEGSPLELGDDDFEIVELSAGAYVSLFGGMEHSAFYVGSNGYITFDAGDKDASDSLFDHFKTPRISGLFDDLAPDQNSVISYKQLEDRVAVTFEDVPEYGAGSTNNFQIEMFFNGTIRITYLEVAATDGHAGLSDGNGIPENFYYSDPNLYDSCILP